MSAEISQTLVKDQPSASQHSSTMTTEFTDITAASVNSVQDVSVSQASASQLTISHMR